MMLRRRLRGVPPELPYLNMEPLWMKSMLQLLFESTQERRIDKWLLDSRGFVPVIDRGHGPFGR